MGVTRYYNIDAYRYTKDFQDKANSCFSYSNLILTAYDACLTWLKDIYYSNRAYSQVQEVTVKTLVEELSRRQHNLCTRIKNYKRVYHTYFLVYDNDLAPTTEDVNAFVDCLLSIIDYWFTEANMENVIQLYNFLFPNRPLTELQEQDTTQNREYIRTLLDFTEVKYINY